MAVEELVTFTFSVYFPILFECVITSVHCFYKDHKYLCACLTNFLKLTFFKVKARKNLLIFLFKAGVIVIITFRYSVNSCPVLTALLFKCISLRWIVS